MQKKGRNARSISKLMQKKDVNAKKRQKIHFQFRNSYKKISKREKRMHIYLDFFRFYIPCAFFCISNLKIHIKKKTKMQKKSIKMFSNCKNKHAKKHEIIFQKKQKYKKKFKKKQMGCIPFNRLSSCTLTSTPQAFAVSSTALHGGDTFTDQSSTMFDLDLSKTNSR